MSGRGIGTGYEEYHCNYCQARCTALRVKCAECTDFDLCLQCFSSGAEMGAHRRDHSYQLIDNGTFPLFSQEWSADEECLMLDAIEQHGFGNWEDVADHIGTKSVDESINHYNDLFLDGKLGKATLEDFKNKIVDHTVDSSGSLSPSLYYQPEVELSITEQQELGYMPNRDDFEKEYDNEAEVLVSGMQCSWDDDDLESALKLAHVDMYIRRLKERQRRKNIARQHGLIASKHKIIASRRKLTKEDREYRDNMRVFSRLSSFTEWEQMLNDVFRERELRVKIKELAKYRRNGITKTAGCQEYDELKLKRERKKENKKKMGSVAPRRTNVSQGKKNEPVIEDVIKSKQESVDSGTTLDDGKSNSSHMLSLRELQLCSSMNMQPAFYTTIKTIILKDNLLRRQGVQVKTKYPPSLDRTQRKLIVSFLKESGWICSNP